MTLLVKWHTYWKPLRSWHNPVKRSFQVRTQKMLRRTAERNCNSWYLRCVDDNGTRPLQQYYRASTKFLLTSLIFVDSGRDGEWEKGRNKVFNNMIILSMQPGRMKEVQSCEERPMMKENEGCWKEQSVSRGQGVSEREIELSELVVRSHQEEKDYCFLFPARWMSFKLSILPITRTALHNTT